ncbi:MAG: MmcQ/YjbR family DNA-binding protein [Chthoniobacterales bacterium]
MESDTFRDYCLKKSGSAESTPFGPENLVFKVRGKMFALLALDEVPPTANLKCDPDRALELRDRYEEVTPGYHMNKKHWNTVQLAGGIPESEIRRMIDHSYELVVQSLTKAERAKLSLA